MKDKKKRLVYVIAFILALLICVVFLKIFAFNKPSKGNSNIDIDIEITEELINRLYSYIPNYSDYAYNTFYTGNYTKKTNLSYSVIGKMVIDYIKSYDVFSLEVVSDEEKEILNLNNVLYKISKDKFDIALNKIIGEFDYNYKDINLDAKTKAWYKNNNYYITESSDSINSNYIIYHDKLSYTVLDNNNTIKIYDYYLKCDKTTSICYNTEDKKEQNTHIKYNVNLNLNNYKDNLKKYVHTFIYKDGDYYWYSSEGAD